MIDALQWPATLVTILASWWVASTHRRKRAWAFWAFLFSNALWTAWGLHTQAIALVILQLCLAVMNVRGFIKARAADAGGTAAP